MTDPTTIAAKLSEAEKQAVIDCRWAETTHPLSYDAHANGEYCCERHATMAGLAVRALLQEQTR